MSSSPIALLDEGPSAADWGDCMPVCAPRVCC